jgi:hypothetical protein
VCRLRARRAPRRRTRPCCRRRRRRPITDGQRRGDMAHAAGKST